MKTINLLKIISLILQVFVLNTVFAKGKYYYSERNNPDFMNSCVKTHPTVYNPNMGGTQGGKKNRIGELVNSVEDAATNGRPVTVAMDDTENSDFAQKCNWKNGKLGTKRRTCLMLVNLPGLDNDYPSYRKKFRDLLPKDTILAVVEDSGGAFRGKGTGKIDIPFRTGNRQKGNNLKSANFAVIHNDRYKPEDGKKFRSHDFSKGFKPLAGSKVADCNWHTFNRESKSDTNTKSSGNTSANNGFMQDRYGFQQPQIIQAVYQSQTASKSNFIPASANSRNSGGASLISASFDGGSR